MPGKMETTSRLAQFVAETSYRDFPSETIKLAKELIKNGWSESQAHNKAIDEELEENS